MAHEPMTELGSLDKQKESQDSRAFLPTPERPHGLPHSRLHCPAEGLVEDAGDCVTLMPLQKHGSTPDEDHPGQLLTQEQKECISARLETYLLGAALGCG